MLFKIKAGIRATDWGTTQKGDKVRLFTLTGKGGMVARITNFGGVVVNLFLREVPLKKRAAPAAAE